MPWLQYAGLINHWGNIFTVIKMNLQLFDSDLITTGLWKEAWILAPPSQKISNLERIRFANNNDLYLPNVSEKKTSDMPGY